MKKFKAAPQTAKRVKRIAAAAMALTLAVPTTAYFSAKASKAEAEEAVPEAVATLTFDKGFVAENKENGLTVVKSEEVLTFAEKKDEQGNYMFDENKQQICELTDEPFIEAGDYKYGVKGNQAVTKYDDDMGSVFMLSDTVNIEEFKKKVEDEVKETAVGEVLQCAVTTECQTQINNPFAGKDLAKGASISYWLKVPAMADDAKKGVNSSLIVFSAKETDNMKVKTTVDGTEKRAEQEVDGKLSIQLSANNDFHYVEGDKAVSYDGDGSVLATPDTWAYVTVSMTDSKVITYVNGAEVSSKDVDATGMMAAMANSETGVFLGGNYSTAAKTVNQYIPTVKGVCMDEVAFYTQAVTGEEATQLYNNAVKKKEKLADTTDMSQYLIEKFTFENGMSGDKGIASVDPAVSSNKVNPEVVSDAQKGNVLRLDNGKASQTSAAILTKNPFAGMDLEGATIDYWVRETATKNGVPASISMSFVDTPKAKNHDKIYETYRGIETQTVLYTKTDMDAMFCEGYTTGTYSSLKNDYKFSTKRNTYVDPESAMYDEQAVKCNEEYKQRLSGMSNWHRVTVVVNNAGIKMYLDGQPLSNNLAEPGGRPTG